MEITKIPPQAIELEEAILGAMLLEKEAILNCMDIVQVESFYKESNQAVYQAILNLYKVNQPIDILTVTQELKRTGKLEFPVGGSYAVASLTNRIASAANIEFHARIVQQKYLAREMYRISINVARQSFNETADVFDLIDNNMREIEKLMLTLKSNKIDTIGELVEQVIDDCILAQNSVEPIGIPCPINALNLHTGGWQKSTVTILAARPGMGKTAFALECAIEPAKKGTPVAFFSLEMTKKQLAARALSMESEMPVQKIINRQTNKLDIDLLSKEGQIFKNIPLYIDDTPEMSIDDLKHEARRLKRDKNIQLIIIDYLQLMKGNSAKRGNREGEISEISRGLKVLSRELDIPIIALSQLSRQTENRPGGSKEPQLSDLRESGAIEQDADNVIFLFRPEYYGMEEYSIGANTYDAKGLFIFILAKFRNGGLGKIKAKWIGYLTKIINYENEEATNTDADKPF